MSATKLADLNEQIQKFWSPQFMAQLRAKQLIAGLVNKDYEGEIKKRGDTVYVSQLKVPVGEERQVGVNADVFETEKLVTERIPIVAQYRATVSHEFEDLTEIQTIVDRENPELLTNMMYAVMNKIQNRIYSTVAPSSSAPDHELAGTTTMDAATLISIRTLAAEAHWLKNKPWYGLLSPQYWAHLLAAQTLTSSDYVSGAQAVESGDIANKRFGFNLFEDDSRTGKYGLFFHPDFLHLVMQTEPRFKVSDLHGNKQFAYVMSVDIVYGVNLGLEGAVKHIRATG